MKFAFSLVASLVALVSIPIALLADTVELKNGQRTEGVFKTANAKKVVIEVGGHLISFDTKQVRAIFLGPVEPPAATKPVPKDYRAMKGALQALNALRSTTAIGTNYRDYSSRVIDTKIIVDRYLMEPEDGDSVVRARVADSMEIYGFAADVWNAKIIDSDRAYLAIADHRTLAKCPKGRTFAEGVFGRRLDVTWSAANAIVHSLSAIFTDGADQLEKAEMEAKAMK